MSFERPIGINALYAELRALAEKPFYIMRHGKTQDDVDGVWSGWDEVDLTPEAEQDVRRAAEFLRPLGIKRIVASPTRRTQHTAQIVSNVLGNIPIITDWRLAAWKLGMLEKQPESEDKIKPYIDDPYTRVPGGESLFSCSTRIKAGLEEANEQNELTGPTLAITHSSGVCIWQGGGDMANCSGELQPASVALSNGYAKKLTLLYGSLKQGDAA